MTKKWGLILALLAVLALSGAAEAKQRPVFLGVFGDRDRFEALTGQRSLVGHSIVGWTQGHSWGSPFVKLFETMGEVPMLGLGTELRGKEGITPLQIARGAGDAYLVALNQALAEWEGKRIYIRPFGEMNGHWNFYCAYNKNGSPRGPSHSTAAFRKAFARVYLIVHGGPGVNAALRRLGMPAVKEELASNPMPRVRVVWNPQGYGSPDLPGNTAQAYYPGDRYVDVVGNDLYNINSKAEWVANEKLYEAHPTKPYSFPEWANWGVDDPEFIRRMAEFVKTHPRTEMLAYYHGSPGSPWDLASKPKTRAAYRKLLSPLGAATA